jgi:ketosteroid isomerase-like protein
MGIKTDMEDPDISAIKQVMSRELSLCWSRDQNADWEAFAGTFLPDAALFPAARPVKTQTLDQFIERMKRLRAEGKLEAFKVTPLGCDVRVFGNVAVAFAACEMLENESTVNREINATVLVRENGSWRIAAQAWDTESGAHKIPGDLVKRKPV